jgi:hypothetical protein
MTPIDTFHYKRRYKLSGYLFQNRYKNIPIIKDEYLMECGRYIEWGMGSGPKGTGSGL